MVAWRWGGSGGRIRWSGQNRAALRPGDHIHITPGNHTSPTTELFFLSNRRWSGSGGKILPPLLYTIYMYLRVYIYIVYTYIYSTYIVYTCSVYIYICICICIYIYLYVKSICIWLPGAGEGVVEGCAGAGRTGEPRDLSLKPG